MTFHRLLFFTILVGVLLMGFADWSIRQLPGNPLSISYTVTNAISASVLVACGVYQATKWHAPDPDFGNKSRLVRAILAVVVIGVPVFLATTLFIFHTIRLNRH